ncbi:MAG: selenocysteine-specific translation elongation factor, partial [Planctomycetota bacterium]
MVNDLILGTAGHIDHGKTSLIGSLTGTNTDRLPEEKKRGITIELGYAFLELAPFKIGIVDVPGHEKFVRQMLAGATGIDLSLLVVAANDSVKQQTREHLDILRFLDLPAGVIAITKSDLVEPDWLELVQEEIRGEVAGTFLEDAPIVATSAKTGEGLEELKTKILSAAEIASKSNRRLRIHAPFKMAIDRAFSIEGHGTVVTGSVSSGTVKTGDAVEIQPGGKAVRIRSVQNHDQAADEVHRGQRAAINLTGINVDHDFEPIESAPLFHLVVSQQHPPSSPFHY